MTNAQDNLIDTCKAIRSFLLEKSPTILVVGDLILDEYIHGTVDRISPEAPIPVVFNNDRTIRSGGAANVANNLLALGADVRLLGVVGEDNSGAELLELLARQKVNVDGVVATSQRRTTQKTRIIAQNQQMLRLDTEDRDPLGPPQANELMSLIESQAASCDAIIVSDYNKGVCVAPVVEAAVSLAMRLGIPLLGDPKGNEVLKYRRATVLTPNLAEAELILGESIDGTERAISAANELREKLGLEAILVTMGGAGMVVSERSTTTSISGHVREVADVTGAGDTVISALCLAMVCGQNLSSASEFANAAASVVVGKLGSASTTLEELLDIFGEEINRNSPEVKQVGQGELALLVAKYKADGVSTVFTNGCFDVLHAGHVELLSKAAALGDVLFVGLNSDDSVRALKGDGRPIMKAEDRVNMLAALAVVDHIVVFASATPAALIETITPDVLVKGADYVDKEVVGADFVTSRGGRVELIPLKKDRSTTSIIELIGKVKK